MATGMRRTGTILRQLLLAAPAQKDATSTADLEFIKKVPKVELHAHINGCIRDNTLLELLENSGADQEALKKLHVQLGDERSLSQCFDLFSRIHRIVTSVEVVERITREAIEDFAADQVREFLPVRRGMTMYVDR